MNSTGIPRVKTDTLKRVPKNLSGIKSPHSSHSHKKMGTFRRNSTRDLISHSSQWNLDSIRIQFFRINNFREDAELSLSKELVIRRPRSDTRHLRINIPKHDVNTNHI